MARTFNLISDKECHLGHQYDHKANTIRFVGYEMHDERNMMYFKLQTNKKDYKIPLVDFSWMIEQPITLEHGEFRGQLLEVKEEDGNVELIDQTDTFKVIIKRSIKNGGEYEVLTPDLELLYTKYNELYNKLKDLNFEDVSEKLDSYGNTIEETKESIKEIKEQLPEFVKKTEIPEVPEVPTKTSQLVNDSNFITDQDIAGKADKTEIPTRASQINFSEQFEGMDVESGFAFALGIVNGKQDKMIADEDYVTPNTADKKYQPAGDYYTKNESDGKFADKTETYTKDEVNRKLSDSNTAFENYYDGVFASKVELFGAMVNEEIENKQPRDLMIPYGSDADAQQIVQMAMAGTTCNVVDSESQEFAIMSRLDMTEFKLIFSNDKHLFKISLIDNSWDKVDNLPSTEEFELINEITLSTNSVVTINKDLNGNTFQLKKAIAIIEYPSGKSYVGRNWGFGNNSIERFVQTWSAPSSSSASQTMRTYIKMEDIGGIWDYSYINPTATVASYYGHADMFGKSVTTTGYITQFTSNGSVDAGVKVKVMGVRA